MEEKIRQGYLYDFYGELLNRHQRTIYESFVLEDLSLAEIAAVEGISRQAVHDVIRRCNKALEGYESKLHLVEKFLHIKANVEEIRLLAKRLEEDNAFAVQRLDDDVYPAAVTERILHLSQDILEEL